MQKKAKIAFLIYSLNSGGAERVVSNLANELIDFFDITIIVFYKCEPFYKLDERIVVTHCLESKTSKFSAIKNFTNHFKLFFSFLRILKKKDINLFIGFMTTSNIYACLASKVSGTPCIISERIHPDHRQLSKFWDWTRKATYRFANVLVVQTESIKTYFESFVRPEKITIIKNPLATDLINKRKSYNHRENIILHVGSLAKQKNQDLLINAFSNVDNEDWRVILIGEGELRNDYQSLINSLNLERKVILEGKISNIEDYYNMASIFVFTSRYEGFPNALTEAMYFGLPCISTDCPSGPSEIINSGENGFLIPVGNQGVLEDKLKILMNDRELRMKFSENSIKRTNEFNPETISNHWLNLINTILS